jgi:ssDNA-binding Zn-finger/Zn-ribbon topoisomerase 1
MANLRSVEEEEMATLTPQKGNSSGGLADAIDRILDKGLVINADIAVSVAGVELLGIKIRAALASFETAAKYGLEFPSGTNYETAAWKEATVGKEQCPQCSKIVEKDQLLNDQCPWCGWKSASAMTKEEALVKVKLT